jgi:hypothetical protein
MKIILVDRAGFEPATFRYLDHICWFANRTFFGLTLVRQYTRLNYRPTRVEPDIHLG